MNYIRLYRHLNINRSFCTPTKSTLVNGTDLAVEKKYLVPRRPVPSKIDRNKLPPRTKIDADIIAHLERLSLVDCANKQGIQTLEEAIAFADQILQVDTTGIEPLVTVLEDRPLRVREDEVTEGNCRKEVLSNATLTEEEYFVAPPGNIPLEPRENLLHEEHSMDLCEKQGFLKRLLNEGVGRSISDVNEILKIGPPGALLQENLKTEWFYSMVINRDNTVFFNNDSFTDTFKYAKEMCLDNLPFGVSEIIEEKQNGESDVGQTGMENKAFGFDKYFLEDKKFLLRTTMFVSPSSAIQFFHQWQRERRTWWRKFSAAPGRYSLSEIQNSGSGCQSVEINANYPWGVELMESLLLSNAIHNRLSVEQQQARDGRRKVQAHYVTSNISLSSIVLNALCDAYDEPLYQGERRPLLEFHRKLAPYKISFTITSTKAAMTSELSELALYLCRKLRTNHVSSLLVPSAAKNTQEFQWRQYDQLGVPYTVILNEDTLRNGIALLRNRDTTLKEQIHISNLPTYVQQLFKNY